MTINNASHRFGSAVLADARAVAKAGFFTQSPNALLVGFMGKKPLWYSQMGGLLLIAGARGGKLRDVLSYNVCAGICQSSMVILDMKGELAAISRDQTPDEKYCIYWNPARLHDLPEHRVNPVDYIRRDSPSLVSDVKVFCENMIPLSGAAGGAYFEGRAQEFLEAVVLTLVHVNGALTLPDLFTALNLIPGGSEAYLHFAYDMANSPFPIAVRVEEEIAAARESSGSNGFQGIMGELLKAFAALSDPVLLRSVSPPFDFSFEDMCKNERAYQLYLMPPAEFVQPWAPVIKAMFVAAMVYKSRAPHAPQQTWIIDECAQLGKFPLVTKLYTYGAGIGIRPWAVFQSRDQMKILGHNADNIITSSAALRSFFAVRDVETAKMISTMIGAQTLEYEDEHHQSRARHAKREAVQALLSGGDPVAAGLNYVHHKQQAATLHQQHRHLRTPDEILNTPADRQYIFADGLPGALYAQRKPYYEQRFMAGRYHPNPYHPPAHRVQVKTRFGTAMRPVVTHAVPQKFAEYPQYQSGSYAFVKP